MSIAMEQSMEISLCSSHVKKLAIPCTSLIDSHVVYHIEVSLSDYSWIVKRRYREFCELHENLSKNFKVDAKLFPPKKWVGNLNPEHIEKRRLSLEAYLQDIVDQLGKIPRHLQIFLEFHVYDILAVTQTLAEKLFKVGDNLLCNEKAFVATPLQLYCISKRLKLPIPTCVVEGYQHDVGNLYDIVYCVKTLKIRGDDNHELKGLSNEDILFDLSLFRNLESLEVLNCNIESLQGIYHLQEKLSKLSVHFSLRLLKDILIDQEVWTRDVCNDLVPNTDTSLATSAVVWMNLTEIDFSHNFIPYIDESITLLHELEILDLSHNNIKEIEHLQDLPKLSKLDLSHNEIESLKDVNTKLGNIKILNLASNRVQLVGGTSKVYSLVELDLSENVIDDVADVMSLADLPCVEVLNLLNNPVASKEMYRSRLLTAFEERVSQVCLDKINATPAEIKNVMRLVAELESYELVNPPINKPATPAKNKTLQRKAASRRIKIKDHDVLESPVSKVSVASMPSNQRKFTDGEQEFKDRVEKIRHLGGDAWLALLNEVQNEYKESIDPRTASLPACGRSADQKNAVPVLRPSTSGVTVMDQHSSVRSMVTGKEKQVRQPVVGHSSLQFGFSAALEDLVNKKMKESEDLVNGTFIVGVEVGREKEEEEEEETVMVEEERMIGVDLKKGVLMEIAIDSGKTCAKHKLDDISSVDILETSDALYVDLLHMKSKGLRHHRDLLQVSGDLVSSEDYQHVARYKMRSLNDTTELFVLLYKFISDSLTTRQVQRFFQQLDCEDLKLLAQRLAPPSEPESSNVPVKTTHQQPASGSTAQYSNLMGISTDLFHQFFTSKFLRQCSLEAELTESGRDIAQNRKEEIHLVLWTSCLPYALPQHELPVCLVLTTLNIYLFKLKDDGVKHPVTSLTKLDDLETRLPLLCCLPLGQLRFVVCGLFELGFRLEFSKRGSRGTFTFLTRDSRETDTFLRTLDEITKAHMRSYDVVQPSETKLERMKQEIAVSCGKAFKDDECILMYTVVREVPDMTSTVQEHVVFTSHTRTLILTNWRLFLCEEDHVHWPLPSYVRDTPSTPQWVVTKHDDIKRIIGIEVFDVIGDCQFVGTSGMSLLLERKEHAQENDSSHKTNVWNIIFKVDEERQQLQRSLAQIWSYNFHGNLQITKSRQLDAEKIRHSSRVDVPSQFFQESLSPISSPPESPSKSRPGKGHRRNASGQYCPHQPNDVITTSLELLRNASAESLQKFFTEKLRPASAGHNDETLVCYAWTGCVAYSHPTREIHVLLILSSLKVYLVADSGDRTIIDTIQNVVFGPGTELCVNWFPLTSLRQVCVGFFDQTFRLETDDPESTFTFITRDYDVTSYFLENLKSILQELGPENISPATTMAGEGSPSIYDANSNSAEVDDENSSEQHFHHSNGVVRFVYPSDDTVEVLKHSIVEFAKDSGCCGNINDVSILLYLLVFQVVNGEKLSRTFMILDQAVCMCLENHVNFPLPLFVKGLPMGSRYQVESLRPLAHIKRIEFSGFNTQDFTIVFEERTQPPHSCAEPAENLENCAESAGGLGENVVVSDSTCAHSEVRWTVIAQTYEEKEKALAMILKFCKENCGEDLPVLRI